MLRNRSEMKVVPVREEQSLDRVQSQPTVHYSAQLMKIHGPKCPGLYLREICAVCDKLTKLPTLT